MIEDRDPTKDASSAGQEPASENGAPSKKVSRLAVWSYVLFNFGDTPFAATILTLYFPLWLTEEYRAGPALFNYATALASLLVVLSAPALGAICDLRQSRKPYLVVFTLITVFCTFSLAFSDELTGSLSVAIVLFVVAVVAFNLINVPYYALLRSASEGRGTGKISGYTQAAGFIGTFIAVIGLTLLVAPEKFLGFTIGGPGEIRQVFGPLGAFVHTAKATVDSNTFLPTAVFFLVFALPAFFFVADVPERAPQRLRLGQAYRNVFATVKGIGAYTGLGSYMVVTLLYMEAALIAIPNMCLFGKDVFAMKDQQISNLIIFSLLFSVVAAFGAGRVSDKIGPKRALLATMGLWVVGILAVTFAWAPWVMYVASPLIFLANGATLAVGTVLVIALSPPSKLTEFMGLYVTVGMVSAVLGPAIVGLLLGVFGGLDAGAYRIGMGSIAVTMVIGIFLLIARVPDARNTDAPS
ncbi:MAG TPA: MFS transporter [Rubrobacter sp.]|nr:MFS transporter [Rubrobacter sp.]